VERRLLGSTVVAVKFLHAANKHDASKTSWDR
jgi:hypothetical protein